MIPGFTGEAAPGFDQPLEMLAACHERIARQCDTLQRLQAHLALHSADLQARQAAQAILTYFDTAAVHHHDDEERNLFPLLELAGAPGACDLVELLTREHEELALAWRRLRPALAELAASRPAALDEQAVQRFVALYRGHIEFENSRLLPLARVSLGADDLARLGRAMAARRRVAFEA
jgi:hemerythrin-like domain-containing protein